MNEGEVSPLTSIVFDFLIHHPKMSLAINDPHGNAPNISLMHYAMEGSTKLLIGTRKAFEKYDALRKNGKVSFLVTDGNDDPLRAVSGHGRAAELPDFEMQFAHTLFKQENIAKWYVEGADDFAMFEIAIDSLRWLDATSGSLKITDLPMPKKVEDSLSKGVAL